MPSRRTVLASGVAVTGALGGCTALLDDEESVGTLDLEYLSDRQVANLTIDGFDIPEPVLRTAVAADRSITTGPASDLDGGLGRVDRAYYRAATDAGAPRFTEYAIGFTRAPASSSGDGIEQLPPIDRAVVATAFDGIDGDGEIDGDDEAATHTFPDGTETDAFVQHVWNEGKRDRSDLLGNDVEAIEHDGTTYRVLVEPLATVPGAATVTAERIAEDDAAFADHVVAEYTVELDDLTEDQRAVVDEAIESRYDATPGDDAFWSVVRKIQRRRLPGRSRDERIVQYDGRTYEARTWGLEKPEEEIR